VAQKPVFDHLRGHGPVTAAAVVVAPAGDHGRAKGHTAAGTQGHRQQPHQVEQQRELLVGPFGSVVGLHAHQAPQPLPLGHQAGQQAGLGLGVGIEKDQQITAAGRHAVVQGPGLAAPAGWQRRRLDQSQRQPRGRRGRHGDGTGAVARVIVDDQHLGNRQALTAQGSQQPRQCGSLVAGRNQHRDPLRRPVASLRQQRQAQVQPQPPAQRPAHQQGNAKPVQRVPPR
jgi:hypothetical protein